MVDRLVLSLINKNMIHIDSFEKRDDNGVFLNEQGKRIVLWVSKFKESVIKSSIKEWQPNILFNKEKII